LNQPVPKVKICCISSIEEARLAIDSGANALGLVSAMPSGPGVISDELIAKIDTERFSVNTAEVKAQEFSRASISASETVRITSDGSSRVNVEGEPEIIETDNKNID